MSFSELPQSLLEPKQDKPIAYDWNQSEIYAGDEVYEITDTSGQAVLVLKDDLENYIETQFGKSEEM